MSGTKECTKCKQKRSLAEYDIDNSTNDLHRADCKDCRKKNREDKRKRAVVLDSTKLFKCTKCTKELPQTFFRPVPQETKGHRSQCLYCEHISNTERRNDGRDNKIEVTITQDEYFKIISNPCYYCVGEKWSYPNQKMNGIDRFHNNQGYTSHNSVPCCRECNMLKNDAPPEKLFKFCVNYPKAYLRFIIQRTVSHLNDLNKQIDTTDLWMITI
jgi:hypothetical protein